MRFVRDDVFWSLAFVVLLGLGTSNNNGHWSMLSFAIVSVGLIVGAIPFVAALRRRGSTPIPERLSGRAGTWLLVGLLAIMPVVALLDGRLLPSAALAGFGGGRAMQVVTLLLLATYLREDERMGTARFVTIGVVTFALGVLAIRLSRAPDIDVWTIQQRATELLLEGKNPYQWVAIPTSDRADDFTVVYNYPPLSIYLALFGRLLGGDPRYGNLLAVIAAGVALRVIARTGCEDGEKEKRPAIRDDVAALSFWLWSPMVFVVDRAWVDPQQVALLAIAIAAGSRGKPTLSAIVLGVALTSKQSMFWLVPLAFVLLRFDAKRWAAMAAGALLPLLPFMIWDFARLKHNLFDFMAGLGPRHDALCFTAFVHHAFGAAFPHQIGFLLAAVAVGAALWRRPVGEGRADSVLAFARAAAITYYVFFFFNRWMFANYYCTVAGFAAITIAAAAARDAGAAKRTA